MALTDERIPYELLIRFGDDGAPKAAHVQYRRRVIVDGEVLKDEPEPAEPLTIDGDFPTSAVLTEATAAALARVTELEGRLAGQESG